MSISTAFRALRPIAFLCCLTAGTTLAQATSASAIAGLHAVSQANRIAADADMGPQTQLSGHLPGWVQSSAQTGKSVDLSASMHLSIVLQRDPTVQAAFTQLLADQQTPGSPMYQQWLTPQQVGQFFGPTASDLAAVTNWLASQGLTVESVAPNGVIVEVSGPASAVASAFHTSFGYFNVGSQARFSATSEPSVPSALVPVLNTISGLSEIQLYPQSHSGIAPMSVLQQASNATSAATGGGSPDYTTSSGNHYLAPGDFNIIYDVASVISGGNTGATIGATPQHIAVIGRSRVTASDVSQYETNTNTAIGVQPVVIIPTNGVDPGFPGTANPNGASAGDQGEATLDVDRTITTAPGAITDLIVSGTPTSGTLNGYDGIYVAATWNINNQLDPIMTISFGNCEHNAGSGGVGLWDALFSTAAAEGISVFVSSGDSGADGCTGSFSPITTAYAASINYICSSTYATCVGGTEFNDTASPTTYWNTTSGTGLVSALSYIPEGAWNEPTTVSGTTTYYIPASSGGGPSVYIAKPTWQTGVTLADSQRDTPDISLSASGHDGYYACLLYAGANCLPGGFFEYFSGTSAASPGMAGIAALANTKAGHKLGNFGPVLFKAYGTTPAAFHDATPTSSGVTSCSLTVPSMCNNSVPNSSGLTTTSPGLQGYALLTGYDLATGLGSLDVAKFIATLATPTVSTTLALTTVSPNPVNQNSTVTLTATLTPSSTTLGAPTGTVVFYANGVAIGAGVTLSTSSPYTATTTTTFTAVGTDSITAIYSGDVNYLTSTASAVSLSVVVAPTFTLNPGTPPALITNTTTGITVPITIASQNAFAGSVALTCSTAGVASAACTILPTPVTLTAGSNTNATLTVSAPIGASGTIVVTVKGTSGTLSVTSTVNVVATAPSFTYSTPASLSFSSGATTGNTATTTLTSANSFAGSVALACSMSISGATYQPTCAVTTPVTLTAGGTATATVTISSTTPKAGGGIVKVAGNGWGLKGGVMFASLVCLISLRRRRTLRSIALLVMLAAGLTCFPGCGGGGAVQTPPQGSAGSYTVTVSGTGTTTGSTISTSNSVTFNVTIN